MFLARNPTVSVAVRAKIAWEDVRQRFWARNPPLGVALRANFGVGSTMGGGR